MDYNTCEQYVLGELRDAQKQIEALKDEAQIKDAEIAAMREMFYMKGVPAPDGGEATISMGVRDGQLNLDSDPTALRRLVLVHSVLGEDDIADDVMRKILRQHGVEVEEPQQETREEAREETRAEVKEPAPAAAPADTEVSEPMALGGGAYGYEDVTAEKPKPAPARKPRTKKS